MLKMSSASLEVLALGGVCAVYLASAVIVTVRPDLLEVGGHGQGHPSKN